MSFRLYESAWVRVEGHEEPLQAHKHATNAGVFVVGDYHYDIDARAVGADPATPAIVSILNLEAIRDAGLRSGYHRDFSAGGKSGRR